MHRLERASDGNSGSQRRTWTHASSHATSEIPLLEILHHQPGVIIADPQVIKLHDARMLDALDDLVFLQESSERVVEVMLIFVPITNDLQRNQRSSQFTLRQIQVGDGPRSDPTNTSIP